MEPTFKVEKKWEAPSLGWLKKKSIGGVAWVLRNHKGEVLSHSRRAFSVVISLYEAKHIRHLWSIKRLCNMRVSNVVFATQATEVVGAVNHPPAWPTFFSQSSELISVLRDLNSWKFKYEALNPNMKPTIFHVIVEKKNL